MITKPYNIFELDISNGLKALPVGTAGGYISLLEAPTNANVKIHLNEREADGIPLKAYHAIEATNIEQIFVTADAVADEKITIVQSIHSDSFKMITPASDVNVDEVTQIVKPVENGIYTADALTQLDKIINPYNIPIISGGIYDGTYTTLLDATLNCDKIKINLWCGLENSGRLKTDGILELYINDILIIGTGAYSINERNDSGLAQIELEVNQSDNIKIKGATYDDTTKSNYSIQKYTLKP